MSRDRQNTIPPELLQQFVATAWREAIQQNAGAAELLFDVIQDNDECFESKRFNRCALKRMGKVSEALARVFQTKNPDGFPNLKGDQYSADVIQSKLKRVPVNLPPAMIDILEAGKLETDAHSAWHNERLRIVRDAATADIKEPYATIFRHLCLCVRDRLPLDPRSFSMVSCPDLPDVPGLLVGAGIDSFAISGFVDQDRMPFVDQDQITGSGPGPQLMFQAIRREEDEGKEEGGGAPPAPGGLPGSEVLWMGGW